MPLSGDGGGELLTEAGGAGYVGRSEQVVVGGGRAVGLLLGRAGSGGPAECPVLCRPQFAAVSLLASGADRRADVFWNGCTVFAGRLPVMLAAFFAASGLLQKKTTTARWW